MPHGQIPGPIQIYHYQPDADSHHRQQAIFTPHPNDQQAYHAPMPTYQPPQGMCYPQPPAWQHAPFPHHGPFVGPALMAPKASPPVMSFAPKIIVEQNSPSLRHLDTKFLIESRHTPSPATPSLSTCPSTASSPPSTCSFQTPTHGGYFTIPTLEDLEYRKDLRGADVHIAPFADSDWNHSGMPEMTECKNSESI